MDRKNLIICSILSCLAIAYAGFVYINKSEKADNNIVNEIEQTQTVEENSVQETDTQAETELKEDKEVIKTSNKKIQVKHEPLKINVNKAETIVNVPKRKISLHNDNSEMPFSTVAGLADLPDVISKSILKIAEKNDIYYLGKNKEKVLVIVGTTEKYSRHNIEFVEIDENGKPKFIPFGAHAVNDKNDGGEWVFDEQTGLPLSHVKHNAKGVVEYSEKWNYSPDEEIKYEMKDREGKVVSVRKETPDGENMRSEHLIYDSNGKTKINVSSSYEGPHLKRFTYYNAESPDDGVTMLNEYSVDGLKIKEAVYSSDYNLKNIYRAEYKNGEKVNLKVSDKDNIVEILSEE